MLPGSYLPLDEPIWINPGRRRCTLVVANSGDRAVQVGSHFHFFEVNRALRFDRVAALGMRLDVPAGTAVRFEPGDRREVTLVAVAGSRRIVGFNGLTNGSVSGKRSESLETATRRGFISAERAGGT